MLLFTRTFWNPESLKPADFFEVSYLFILGVMGKSQIYINLNRHRQFHYFFADSLNSVGH